jgi:hypothetical protein
MLVDTLGPSEFRCMCMVHTYSMNLSYCSGVKCTVIRILVD